MAAGAGGLCPSWPAPSCVGGVRSASRPTVPRVADGGSAACVGPEGTAADSARRRCSPASARRPASFSRAEARTGPVTGSTERAAATGLWSPRALRRSPRRAGRADPCRCRSVRPPRTARPTLAAPAAAGKAHAPSDDRTPGYPRAASHIRSGAIPSGDVGAALTLSTSTCSGRQGPDHPPLPAVAHHADRHHPSSRP